ncbi:MAG: hypothetical protein R6U58_11680 [Bacteroidales bacterium]
MVKLDKLSGKSASIYSVVIDDEQETLLDKFLKEYSISFKNETFDILKRLKTIGHKTGARAHFFKEREGRPGDGVCALYDDPDSNLRLYCIRYGTQIVVVGRGGYKAKLIRAFQENKTLKEANYFLRQLSIQITERIKENDIIYINDHLDFEGDLEFEIQEE